MAVMATAAIGATTAGVRITVTRARAALADGTIETAARKYAEYDTNSPRFDRNRAAERVHS